MPFISMNPPWRILRTNPFRARPLSDSQDKDPPSPKSIHLRPRRLWYRPSAGGRNALSFQRLPAAAVPAFGLHLPESYNGRMRIPALLFAAALAASSLYAAPALFAEEVFSTSAGTVKITPVRHASMMIEAGGKVIQVDPWSQDTEARYAAMPKADLILITDFHGDHMDPHAISWVKKAGTKIIAPEVVTSSLKTGSVIRNGETQTWEGWTIEAVPMYNFTAGRGPGPGKFFHDKGRGNGYVLTYGGKRFYISGDTEATPEMKALKNIDVAFVCMNLPYTMPPQEAAAGVRAFAPKIVYPYHYRGSDLKVFEDALKGSGVEVRIRNWYE